MKTDRELLELAARVYGLDGYIHEWINGPEFIVPGENPVIFNPLTDDGDALRLAVKLGMRVYVYNGGGDDYTCVATDELSFSQETIKVMHDGDSASATRRAITRAAAQMQLNKEQAT